MPGVPLPLDPAVVVPEGALACAGLGLLLGPRELPRAGAGELGARVALLVALLGALARAPHRLDQLGAPLCVLGGAAALLVLARARAGEARTPDARGCGLALLGAAALLRSATWPGAGTAPLCAAVGLTIAVLLSRGGGLGSPAGLAFLGVALPAGVLPGVERLVARGALQPAPLAWAGALTLCAGHALAARRAGLAWLARGVVLAQAGGLALLAALSARAAIPGALAGGLVAAAVPVVGLLATAALDRREPPAGLARRNPWLAAALLLSLLTLVGLPLTLGWGAKVRLLTAGAATGLLAPVGLALLNAVVLLALALRALSPLLYGEAREPEPWVGDSGATLLAAGAAAAAVGLELCWPGLGAGG
ncbi:MAG: hypothetical protein AB7N76_37260 [Planctomycetota bacterium]